MIVELKYINGKKRNVKHSSFFISNIILLQSKYVNIFITQKDTLNMTFINKWISDVFDLMSRMGLV